MNRLTAKQEAQTINEFLALLKIICDDYDVEIDMRIYNAQDLYKHAETFFEDTMGMKKKIFNINVPSVN